MLRLFSWSKNPDEEKSEEVVPRFTDHAAGSRHPAPAPEMRYFAGLIDKLKRDHQALFTSYRAILAAFQANDIAVAAEELGRFRLAINSHLTMEGVRLYAYLERELSRDPENQALVHDFRREMDRIGQSVVGFLAKYAELGRNPALSDSFGRDLEAVGKVLTQRIQREEVLLYPLYTRAPQ